MSTARHIPLVGHDNGARQALKSPDIGAKASNRAG